MGPTASGKTALACELYDTGRYELISVDSALVYRGMDIGTAKPSAEELARYPHHLIDLIEPEGVYSAASFVEDAKRTMDEVYARGKIPLLVGGTMLYFRSLFSGMADMPAADAEIRAEIQREGETHGWEWIHQQLAKVDPRSAARFLPNDRQRIMRALEVYRSSGRAITDYHDEQAPTKDAGDPENGDYRIFALVPDRPWLHERIALRLEQMWQAGFWEEVQNLYKRNGLTGDHPSMRSVGYRQAWEYLDMVSTNFSETSNNYYRNIDALDGNVPKSVKEKALYATRQLAKRQYTWIRSLTESHTIQQFETVTDGFIHLRKQAE